MVKTVSSQQLKQWLDQDIVYLIDVREFSEYQSGYIETAILIPLNQFVSHTIPDVNKKIVIYCRSGVRSMIACQQVLAKKSKADVYNLQGGILAWAHSGMDVKKPRN